ncbi:hypothetical protein [Aquimarina celericrescens]|uniref:YcxB-like protein domain-containing protein n=1 Tax=Aquimarina celericrescens TaxID=1964542 RepID=A0ABW5AZB6_9FLAO|nr:hypothetical protein [Aquimarina celericrescens]
MKVTLKDRIDFSIRSIKKHSGILAILLLFISIGSFLIYIGTRTEDYIFFYAFGGLMAGMSLFAFWYTMPSSFLYYYEQEMTKKYGSYAIAKITHKEIEDRSYQEKVGNRIDHIEELHYIISYTFEYRNIMYNNSFYVAGEACFNGLTIGSTIPIKFLRTNPKKSSVRRLKLSKELGLEKKLCE